MDNIEMILSYVKENREGCSPVDYSDEEIKELLQEESMKICMRYDGNKIKGILVVDMHPYYIKNKKGEVVFFHNVERNSEDYKELFNDCILKYGADKLELFTFLRKEQEWKKNILKELHFEKDGMSVEMRANMKNVGNMNIPADYKLRVMRVGKDEEDWCTVRNIGFSEEGIRTPDTVPQYWEGNEELHIKEGMMLLYHDSKPIGSVRASKIKEDGKELLYISVLCVIPEYRGKGLGRNLLKAAVDVGRKHGLNEAVLEVDAVNERALKLYEDEGFSSERVLECFVKRAEE